MAATDFPYNSPGSSGYVGCPFETFDKYSSVCPVILNKGRCNTSQWPASTQLEGGAFSHPEKAPHAHFLAWVFFRALFRSSGLGSEAEGRKELLKRQKNLTGHTRLFSRPGFGGLRPKEQNNL